VLGKVGFFNVIKMSPLNKNDSSTLSCGQFQTLKNCHFSSLTWPSFFHHVSPNHGELDVSSAWNLPVIFA